MAMLRQTPTSSPVVRLRAQTDRMGRRIANIRSGATSVMGPAIRQEVYTSLKSMRWRKKHNLKADASFEECIEAAITYKSPRAGSRGLCPEDRLGQRPRKEGAGEDHRRHP